MKKYIIFCSLTISTNNQKKIKQNASSWSLFYLIFVLMQKLSKNVIFFGLILFFIQCTSNESHQNIERYYYPYKELINGGAIYEYQPIVNDTLVAGKNDLVLSEYYKYEYFPRDKVLVTTQFDKFCRQSALYRDEIVENGVLQLSTRLYEYADFDTTRPKVTDVEIEVGNVFPFEVNDSSSFLYKIKYNDDIGGNNVQVAYKRTFKGMTTHVYNGKSYECVEFDVTKRFFIQNIEEGDFSPEIQDVERYAKGIGLIYYTSNGTPYELVDTYQMDDFIKKCNQLFFRDQ